MGPEIRLFDDDAEILSAPSDLTHQLGLGSYAER
jgi:hypothetical protein